MGSSRMSREKTDQQAKGSKTLRSLQGRVYTIRAKHLTAKKQLDKIIK